MILQKNARETFQLYLKRNAQGEIIETIEQSFERVAYGIAAFDESPRHFGARLLRAMSNLELLPNRPAWFGLNRQTGMTSACTMLDMSDDLAREPDGIMPTLTDIARIQQAGSGVGVNMSRLRGRGSWIKRTGGRATGPCGFLHGFNGLLRTIQQGGYLQGANNASIHVDHPDIAEFIELKLEDGALDQYNTNVFLTDEFMERSDEALFDKIAYAMWKNGGLGVQFWDTVQRGNAIPGYGKLVVSNPCGEFFGFDRESCCPSYINLTKFVRGGDIDWLGLGAIARTSTRMLDNLINANRYIPGVPKLEKMAKLTRRAGTGIVGLADMLAMLNLHYDSDAARATAAEVMHWILIHCTKESVELAQIHGSFPLFEQSIYADGWTPPPEPEHGGGFRHPVAEWPDPSQGIRNCGFTVIAPGSFGSQAMGVEGYGCEPIFAADYTRATSHVGDQHNASALSHRPAFVTALELSPAAHIGMVAALQPYVTEAISKTVNLPAEATVEDVKLIVRTAWAFELKGLTVYRSGSRDIEVLCPACQLVTDVTEL